MLYEISRQCESEGRSTSNASQASVGPFLLHFPLSDYSVKPGIPNRVGDSTGEPGLELGSALFQSRR